MDRPAVRIHLATGKRCALFLVALSLVAGCANQPPLAPRDASSQPLAPPVTSREPFVKENLQEMQRRSTPPPPLTTPAYQPVSDDVSPAHTRLVSIQARNTALGDVLQVIADAAGLNLIIGDGVRQERPITITLKRFTADDALATILTSADYFYTIKNNILSVQATGTKVFELGHPALVQGYQVDVGGDILGSAAGLTAAGSGNTGNATTSSGSSGNTGSANIKGSINQSVRNDGKAFDFWESLEKSLRALLLAPQDSAPAAGAAAAGPQPPRSEERGVRQNVVINRLTGTIVVTATRRNLSTIEEYLDRLKAALNRQVLVEARVIEVQLNAGIKYGIDWSFLSNINNYGQLGGGFGAVASSADFSGSLNSAAPNFRIGTITSGSKGEIKALLTALKTQGDVKTLSNPRINVMNGQTALLTVGRNTNFVSKVTSTISNAGTANTITYTVDTSNVLSGIMIGIAPTINSKGEISMAITPIISDLVSLNPTNIGSGSNQTTIQIPVVDLRELSTTVKVHNGEMIVIGGLIANKRDQEDEKIPFIGELPWLGALFSRKNYQDTRTELVVVLQPYLVGND